jgi:hypothetical protein
MLQVTGITRMKLAASASSCQPEHQMPDVPTPHVLLKFRLLVDPVIVHSVAAVE